MVWMDGCVVFKKHINFEICFKRERKPFSKISIIKVMAESQGDISLYIDP